MQPWDMDAILPGPIIELAFRNQIQRCSMLLKWKKIVLHDAMTMYLLNEEIRAAL